MNKYINNLPMFNNMIRDYFNTLNYYGYKIALDKNSKYFEVLDNRCSKLNSIITINFVNPVGKYKIWYPFDVSVYLLDATKEFAKYLQKFEKKHPDVVKTK